MGNSIGDFAYQETASCCLKCIKEKKNSNEENITSMNILQYTEIM